MVYANKYLGYFVHEHINNEHHAEILTNAASRSFARIHSIFKSIGNMGVRSYETLYNAYVLPIMNYASGIWGFSDFSKPQVLQNRITRFFLGVHRFVPLAATKSELDWIGCREARWIEMLRLFNRFNEMDKSRLPNIILKWDQSLGLNTWYSEIQYILAYLGLNIRPSDGDQYDLTNARNYLLKNNSSSWQLEASRTPKLRTYIKIHDFSKIQTLVKANITRYQRSLITQLKCGILPLRYETDRYQGIAPENRVCKICDMNVPEDELHFVFHCPSPENVRSRMFVLFSDTEFDLSDVDKLNVLSQMMNADNIVISAECIEALYKERKRLVYLDV